MSQEGSLTNVSAIGDGIATDLVYKSQHVTIMLGGFIIGRIQDISFQINKNIEKFHEVGSTSPFYAEGELDFTGTFTGLYFDQAKIRLAIGRDKDYVGVLTEGEITTLDSSYTKAATERLSSQLFGLAATWPRSFKFDLVIQLHREGSGGVGPASSDLGFTQFVLNKCMINTYDFTVPLNRAVTERIAFVFHGVSAVRFPS